MERASAEPAAWSRGDTVVAAVLVLCTLLARVPSVYSGGMGDADSMVMAAGIARGLAPDATAADAVTYGRQVGPGMALLLRAVGPWFLHGPQQVLPFLNGFGWVAGAVLAWPLYALYRRWMRRATAVGCTVLVLTAPLVWELGTYFHPVVPATVLLLLALLCARGVGRSPGGIARGLVVLALGTAALLLRAEVALVVPALFVIAATSAHPRRQLLLVTAVTFVAVAAFLVVVAAVARGAPSAPAPLRQYVHDFAVSYFRPRAMVRNVVWAGMGVGLGTLALAAAGAWRAWAVRGRVVVAVPRPALAGTASACDAPRGVARGVHLAALVWAVVPALFWLPNPVPLMRHFLLIVPVAGALAGWLLLRRMRGSLLVSLCALAATLNLLVPEVVYGVAGWLRPRAVNAPHGSFFSHHHLLEQQNHRTAALVEEIARLTNAPVPTSRGTASQPVFVEVDWSGYGHVLYWLATSTPPWHRCTGDRVARRRAGAAGSTDAPALPSAGSQCYCRGDAVLELFPSGYDLDLPALRAAVARVREAQGHVVLSPRAAAALGAESSGVPATSQSPIE